MLILASIEMESVRYRFSKNSGNNQKKTILILTTDASFILTGQIYRFSRKSVLFYSCLNGQKSIVTAIRSRYSASTLVPKKNYKLALCSSARYSLIASSRTSANAFTKSLAKLEC